MRAYSAATAMTAASLPKRDMKGTVRKLMMRAKMRVMALAAYMPMPITRLMASRSPLPRYWLMRTEEPLWMPNIISCTTKTGMLARVTPARGPSPRVPTMKVSTRPRELVMRFWMRMGRARVKSRA